MQCVFGVAHSCYFVRLFARHDARDSIVSQHFSRNYAQSCEKLFVRFCAVSLALCGNCAVKKLPTFCARFVRRLFFMPDVFRADSRTRYPPKTVRDSCPGNLSSLSGRTKGGQMDGQDGQNRTRTDADAGHCAGQNRTPGRTGRTDICDFRPKSARTPRPADGQPGHFVRPSGVRRPSGLRPA